MLAKKVAAGEHVVKKRKERSDKGVPRVSKGGKKAASGEGRKEGGRRMGDKEGAGLNEDDGNNDGNQESRQPPKKKQKYKAHIGKKLPPTMKSNEFIDSDSEDDDDE